MARTTIASLTKDLADYKAQVAKLGAENAALRAQVSALQFSAAARGKAPAAVPHGPRPEPTDFGPGCYFDYVNACRTYARTTRNPVVTYKTREQFVEAHVAAAH